MHVTSVTSFSSQATSANRLKTAFVHSAFAIVAVACMLVTRPGFASDVQAPPVIASADLTRPASVGPSSARSELVHSRVEEMHRQDTVGARESTSSAGSIVEPLTIAVLGFTAAALIALRRKKNASAKTVVAGAVS